MKKELYNEKVLSSILNYLYRYLEKDISYDNFKEIILDQQTPSNKVEKKLKNAWDMTIYLFNNIKQSVDEEFLKKVLYIYSGLEIDSYILNKITSIIYDYLKPTMYIHIIESHIKIYEVLDILEEEDRLIISIMMMNYLFVKYNMPVCVLQPKELKKYEALKTNNNHQELYEFLIYKRFKRKTDITLSKDILTKEEIIEALRKEEDFLKERYKLKHLILYGSYVKKRARVTSDIDLMGDIRQDMTYEEKETLLKEAESYLTSKLKKIITISEYDSLILDKNIKTMENNIKIY